MGELNGRVLFSDLQAMAQESHPVHLSKSINQPSCGIVDTLRIGVMPFVP
jgi:hypothetical protein